MNKEIIVTQLSELDSLIEDAPITTALKLDIKTRLDKIKENLLTESLKEDLKELVDEDGQSIIDSPVHYQSFVPGLNIEAIDCMRAAFGNEDVKSFCLCNALKYVFRCYSKGKNTDIAKAQWYLNKFMELGGFE